MHPKESDTRIWNDVSKELGWDARVPEDRIEVAVIDGVVTLRGVVPSRLSARAAVGDVWLVPGVRHVEDALEVRPPPGADPTGDDELERRVVNAIRWDPDVEIADFGVEVRDGEVTLQGTVDGYWRKWRAAELAMSVAGVNRVRDHMAVVPTESREDERIAEELMDALRRRGLVDPDALDVSVENGKVTLTGVLPSLAAREAAFEATMLTPGVRDIEGEVTVAV